jgi:hypothetical protein
VIIMDSNKPICKMDERLDAFHDGELSPSEATVVEEHVTTCPHCAAKLAEIRQLVQVLRAAPPVAPPAELSSKLDSIIDQQGKVVAWRSRAVRASAAVAAVAVVVLGLRSFLPATQDEGKVAKLPDKVSPTIAKSTQPATVDVAKALVHERGTEVQTHIASVPKQHNNIADQNLAVPPGGFDPKGSNPVIAQGSPQNQTITTMRDLAKEDTTPKVIATNDGVAQESALSSDEIAELPTSSNSFTNAVGVATDEDGLYDIQM